MTFQEFDAVSDKIIEEVRKMRDTKGKEYAGTKDRFDNFNRLAARTGVPREIVWQVYFTKHIDALESFLRTGEVSSNEPIEGRIVDCITYLLLLAGMLKENNSL
jgi:hypothetical protein